MIVAEHTEARNLTKSHQQFPCLKRALLLFTVPQCCHIPKRRQILFSRLSQNVGQPNQEKYTDLLMNCSIMKAALCHVFDVICKCL